MSRQIRSVTDEDVALIALAIMDVTRARDRLKKAGARQAARYTARALKSVEGAYRHADRLRFRQTARPGL